MEQISTVEFQKQFTPSGYIRINIDGNWIFEHKYLVSRHIGRELTKEEVVHHISGVKSDNRLSNLFLFPNQKEHRKFENKVKQFGWTRQLIRRVNSRWEEYFKDE